MDITPLQCHLRLVQVAGHVTVVGVRTEQEWKQESLLLCSYELTTFMMRQSNQSVS